MSKDTLSITVMSGPQDGYQYQFPLPQGSGELTLNVGRDETCDIPLTYDNQVSRSHAQVVCAFNDDTLVDAMPAQRLKLTLVDVGSRNGTLFRDRRLFREQSEIDPGELFRVGRVWLRIDP